MPRLGGRNGEVEESTLSAPPMTKSRFVTLFQFCTRTEGRLFSAHVEPASLDLLE